VKAVPDRRRPPFGAALLGLIAGALVALVLAVPASWLAAGLAQASGGRLLLAEARGSAWTGSAVLVLAAGPGARDARALPGRLQWRLRPAWGPHGAALALRLEQACCLPQPLTMHLQPGLGRWRLVAPVDAPTASATAPDATADLPPRVRWPADSLAGLGTPWNTLMPGGTLQLATPGFELEWVQGRLRFSGRAEVQLLGLTARISTLPWLGDYRLVLAGDAARGDAATVELATLRGALQLSGRGQVVSGRLRFQGQAEAAPGSEAALANLLNIIGRRQGAQSLITIG
jgi:general secretion pathway protein N